MDQPSYEEMIAALAESVRPMPRPGPRLDEYGQLYKTWAERIELPY